MTRKHIPGAGLGGVAFALSLGAISCTGMLEGDVAPGDGGGGTGNATAGAGPTGGSVTTTGTPSYKAIHRLSRTEYNATVADVLQTSLAPANGSWRDGEINGFDNIADQQTVDTDQYQRYFDAAGTLADDAFANAAFKTKYVTCSTPDDACVNSVIEKLGLRLFRRPLAPNEVATYKRVYQAATTQLEGHEGSLKHVLRALLASSEFLFRMEFDANPSSTEKHPLSSYELATRLSYFLWSSAPDEALLGAAADQSILQDAAIIKAVDRLLADPLRSARFVENFYGQWLGGRRVADHAVAPDVYESWNPELAGALAQEMFAYFADFLNKDRSWLQFLTEDVNFVNAPLAQLYGMPAPNGAGMQETRVTTDKRRGFLGLGGFLAQSSLDRRTSPTLRGRWIMINLLCTHPPAPPDNVPMIEAAAGGTDLSKGNVRAVLEKHRANATCASCHQLFDPYGIPLEQFDGIGAYRTTYGDGSPVDLNTDLIDGTHVASVDELTDELTQDPLFKQCIADNMYSYGLGRVLGDKDRPYLDTIQQQWNNGTDVPSIRRLIHSIVLAEGFRSRSGIAAP
jgi:hypothetical protein